MTPATSAFADPADRKAIDYLSGICRFDFRLEDGLCVEISFHDEAAPLGGTIRRHPEKAAILKRIAGMRHLKRLDLRKCRTGPLPHMETRSLEWLDLSCNGLSEVPGWVVEQTRLRHLSLGANGLTEIPGLSHLPIETLKLHKNRIRRMPSVGGGLKSLNLFLNDFTALPDLSGLPLLEVFTFGVSDARSLPPLSCCPNLRWLTIAVTQIGELPDDLCGLMNLEGLQLPKNRIERLPERIGDLTKLRSLTLYANSLTRLPPSFFRLELDRLSLYSNPLIDPQAAKVRFGDIGFLRI